MKELWFRTNLAQQLRSHKLRRTFRELPVPEKNNNYAAGEIVLVNLHDGFGQLHGNFHDTFQVKITNVYVRRIGEIEGQTFVSSDAASQQDLAEKFSCFYNKAYSVDSMVRVIEFEYVPLADYSKFI